MMEGCTFPASHASNIMPKTAKSHEGKFRKKRQKSRTTIIFEKHMIFENKWAVGNSEKNVKNPENVNIRKNIGHLKKSATPP